MKECSRRGCKAVAVINGLCKDCYSEGWYFPPRRPIHLETNRISREAPQRPPLFRAIFDDDNPK